MLSLIAILSAVAVTRSGPINVRGGANLQKLLSKASPHWESLFKPCPNNKLRADTRRFKVSRSCQTEVQHMIRIGDAKYLFSLSSVPHSY